MALRKKQRKTTPKNKYITRIDSRNSHGWYVRWSSSGQWDTDTQSKFFSDGVYGGKHKALLVARQFRDRKYQEIGQAHLLSQSGHLRAPVRRYKQNTSGVIGVYLSKYMDSRLYEREAWIACGMLGGREWKRSFATRKHGFKEAFLMACKQRYKHHGTLILLDHIKNLPCRPEVPFEKRLAA